ncbi:hypothetical protein Tco_0052724 [Tanacetum coccineum]
MKVGMKRCKKNCFNSSYKEVWVLCDLHTKAKGCIGTNGFLETRRDERGTLFQNKAGSRCTGYDKKKWDYDEDFGDLKQKGIHVEFMGELTFFLGLQVKQSNGGIFSVKTTICEIFSTKFDFRTIKPASTPLKLIKSLGSQKMKKVEMLILQVTPQVSHLPAVTRSLGDYVGGTKPHDKINLGGCNILARKTSFLAMQRRNKQLCFSSTEAEYCSNAASVECSDQAYAAFDITSFEIVMDDKSSLCDLHLLVVNPWDADSYSYFEGRDAQRHSHTQSVLILNVLLLPSVLLTLKGLAEIQRTADYQGRLGTQEGKLFQAKQYKLKRPRSRKWSNSPAVVSKHHALLGRESTFTDAKETRKRNKKNVFSVRLGRNKDIRKLV